MSIYFSVLLIGFHGCYSYVRFSHKLKNFVSIFKYMTQLHEIKLILLVQTIIFTLTINIVFLKYNILLLIGWLEPITWIWLWASWWWGTWSRSSSIWIRGRGILSRRIALLICMWRISSPCWGIALRILWI